jgi:3-hydroxymyristoyl/3-hydroxydecanoyl-(acyl carrier protein) dehydratase
MTTLSFGSGVVQRLIPHRPPLLLVDRVDGFERAPRSLRACRHVSANDPIFLGHFPALAIYPGVLVLEGLAQTAAILRVLTELERKAVEAGGSSDDVISALHNLELGHRLDPRFRPGWGEERLAKGPSMGFLVASEIKFKKPVFPGDRLAYSVVLERELGAL